MKSELWTITTWEGHAANAITSAARDLERSRNGPKSNIILALRSRLKSTLQKHSQLRSPYSVQINII